MSERIEAEEQTDKETEGMKAGAVDLKSVEIIVSKGKWTYDWTGIGEAIKAKKGYVLPLTAKLNSIQTGLKKNEIEGRVARLKDSDPEQLIIVPK